MIAAVAVVVVVVVAVAAVVVFVVFGGAVVVFDAAVAADVAPIAVSDYCSCRRYHPRVDRSRVFLPLPASLARVLPIVSMAVMGVRE